MNRSKRKNYLNFTKLFCGKPLTGDDASWEGLRRFHDDVRREISDLVQEVQNPTMEQVSQRLTERGYVVSPYEPMDQIRAINPLKLDRFMTSQNPTGRSPSKDFGAIIHIPDKGYKPSFTDDASFRDLMAKYNLNDLDIIPEKKIKE